MSPRYVVRRSENGNGYTIWDCALQRTAVENGRERVNLGFDEALDTADLLNASTILRANNAPSEQCVSQQQQQPQPKKK